MEETEAQSPTAAVAGESGHKAAQPRSSEKNAGLELLESAGFWVDSGLSLPARAGYDVRADVMR